MADGVFAYLQPDGSWGWSNAGLVVGDSGSLLVDTLFDLKLTREMIVRSVTALEDPDLLVDVIVRHIGLASASAAARDGNGAHSRSGVVASVAGAVRQ